VELMVPVQSQTKEVQAQVDDLITFRALRYVVQVLSSTARWSNLLATVATRRRVLRMMTWR
jgi:hypothetical protein